MSRVILGRMRTIWEFLSKMKKNQMSIRSVVTMFIGLIFGFTMALWLRQFLVPVPLRRCQMSTVIHRDARPRLASKELGSRKLIMVGVMTAEKFLDTRAKAVYETWGKSLPNEMQVLFFSSSSSRARLELPVVSLPGVDDSYPPQRKSMMMLKHMHDNYIDKFDWFMRSDDDVYVRPEKLLAFLRTLNSSQDIYLGQAGTGAKDEKEELKLGTGDNFCMGGPGVVMTRSVLKKIVPNIGYCLNNLLTTHEDVEVGRCIKRFVGITCTWAFEMQSLFYHNHSKWQAFKGNINTKAVRKAVTLHPIKEPTYMYRLHAFFMSLKIQEHQHRALLLQHSLKKMRVLLHSNISALSDSHKVLFKEVEQFHHQLPQNNSMTWEMFTPKKVFSTVNTPPEQGMKDPIKTGLNQILGQTMLIINEEARKVLHRSLEFQRLNHGYMRVHPIYGAQYSMDMLMTYHRHIGPNRRKMTVHVRHHAHLQQAFGNLVYRATPFSPEQTTIHIILPLAGRIRTFERFMKSFERNFLQTKANVKLLVVYFTEVASFKEHKELMQTYQRKYPDGGISWLEALGKFSRALGLTLGANQFDPNALLFFCDVDLELSPEFAHRCRTNTVLGKRIYYPMVFSQFDPNITYASQDLPKTPFFFSKNAGFWRQYAFGIVCLYNNDLKAVGGFDTTIVGWGLEDVDLFDKFVKSSEIEVFRAPDRGLVHIYHPVVCDPQLERAQLEMCHASRSSSYAAQLPLLRYLYSKGYLKD